jgi:hypothetical protein
VLRENIYSLRLLAKTFVRTGMLDPALKAVSVSMETASQGSFSSEPNSILSGRSIDLGLSPPPAVDVTVDSNKGVDAQQVQVRKRHSMLPAGLLHQMMLAQQVDAQHGSFRFGGWLGWFCLG